MKVQHVRSWENLRVSYWFLPGLMAFMALALAAAITYADWLAQHGRLPGLDGLHVIVADARGARIVLSTIAGSTITVAGVIFSITIVVLNSAATQFGPRLVRNFMEHPGTQTVLGIYVGTFIFCLIALSAVRTEDQNPFVPQHAIAAGLFLGIVSCAALIYFIHHVSVFIQAPRIVDNVANRLEAALRADYPMRTPEEPEPSPDDEEQEAQTDLARFGQDERRAICARDAGYLQAIDLDGLLALAVERDLVLQLNYRAGRFVFAGRPLAYAARADRLDDKTVEAIVAAFISGPNRTPTQDLEYSVRQLVEIALRALSPGINDPFTAANCIDRLGAALMLLGTRKLRSRYLRDAAGRIRLVTDSHTYRGVVSAAFNQIRQHARGNVAVSLRLLNVIGAISASELPRPFRDALREQAEAIYELNRDRPHAARDRNDIERHYRKALETLERGAGA